ncbi:MAG TPA: S41 family peptidase [Gemmatimonadales bacterium]|nr:S41 family peptidase [Gemmatimonadales bacterium]
MRHCAVTGCIIILAAAAAAPLCAPVSAQTIGAYERGRGHNMLRTVRERLEKHYYDSSFHGLDLRAAAARADSQIGVARSNGEIIRVIAGFVQGLDDSHTWFSPPRRVADVEYGFEMQMIGDSCYVVAVDPETDAASKGLHVGDRVLALDRYAPSRADFSLLENAVYELNRRPTVQLDVEGADGSRRTLEIRAKFTKRPRMTDLATLLRELELSGRELFAEGALDQDVSILRLAWFGARSDIDRVMDRAGKAGTLILDLRGNPGGLEDGLVRLVGHVFDRHIVVATIRGRRDTRALESRPVKHPFTGALLVLIDSRSGSSSEIFAYLVQREGRGAVVGDRSAGAVKRSMFFEEATGAATLTLYGLWVTVADVIMPDGVHLEGRGVEPDALVLPTSADLAAGRDPALAMALTMAGYPTDAARAGTLLPRRDRGR